MKCLMFPERAKVYTFTQVYYSCNTPGCTTGADTPDKSAEVAHEVWISLEKV